MLDKACNENFPGWDDLKGPDGKPLQECDEFPFASTYDGAGKFNWDGAQFRTCSPPAQSTVTTTTPEASP
ncbi:NucA/NucB deoxyribonuclease domain-containing protein [Actinomadura spongiicola]